MQVAIQFQLARRGIARLEKKPDPTVSAAWFNRLKVLSSLSGGNTERASLTGDKTEGASLTGGMTEGASAMLSGVLIASRGVFIEDKLGSVEARR